MSVVTHTATADRSPSLLESQGPGRHRPPVVTGDDRRPIDREGAREEALVPLTPPAPPATPAPPTAPADRPGNLLTDPYGEWIRRARAAGHPVISMADGRFRPDPLPVWSPAMPPNDLLDAARAYAQARVSWVHVVMPTLSSLLALGASIHGPRPSGPAVRPGTPAGVPWPRLVAQQHIAPCAISDTRDGVTTHALDLPVAWLSCPIAPAGPPSRR